MIFQIRYFLCRLINIKDFLWLDSLSRRGDKLIHTPDFLTRYDGRRVLAHGEETSLFIRFASVCHVLVRVSGHPSVALIQHLMLLLHSKHLRD